MYRNENLDPEQNLNQDPNEAYLGYREDPDDDPRMKMCCPMMWCCPMMYGQQMMPMQMMMPTQMMPTQVSPAQMMPSGGWDDPDPRRPFFHERPFFFHHRPFFFHHRPHFHHRPWWWM